MKRAALRRLVVVLGIAMLLLGSIPGAMSATGTGTIRVGHPLTTNFSSTEWEFGFTRHCNLGNTASNEVDALIIDMGSDTHLRVSGTSDTSGLQPISFNVAVWDSTCDYEGLVLTNGGNDIYVGTLGNKWAVVSLWRGANVSVTWKTCTPFVSPFTSCY